MRSMNTTQLPAAGALALLLAALAAAALADPRAMHQQSQQVLREDLAGEPGKEVVATLYTLPPGYVVTEDSRQGWHIHPDAQEVSYVLEGAFKMEIEGQGTKELKAGEAIYLPPNVVHRGMNPGNEMTKLYVVRFKPKDKPLLQEVPH
jgi:quercetin dioxygenase-like cupin family protein